MRLVRHNSKTGADVRLGEGLVTWGAHRCSLPSSTVEAIDKIATEAIRKRAREEKTEGNAEGKKIQCQVRGSLEAAALGAFLKRRGWISHHRLEIANPRVTLEAA